MSSTLIYDGNDSLKENVEQQQQQQQKLKDEITQFSQIAFSLVFFYLVAFSVKKVRPKPGTATKANEKKTKKSNPTLQSVFAVEPESVTVSTKTTSESAITSDILLQQLTVLSPLQNNVLDQPSSRHDLPLLEPPSSYPSQQQTRVLNRPVPLRNSSPISQVLSTSPHPSQHMSTPSLSSQISSSNFAPLAASSQRNFTSIQRPSNSSNWVCQ
ncbi:unnamed protein product [Didymodactylos carnosus]|uniref:Uncharacterized protein n=1 Tax=Didymodactylos carnosus TaxID=1234261 RepID=A0A815K8V5_9BILA|nr:unnamed protein product [Didymodactylos carnosus]CAF4284430.1 unnamed protein product [Didymodactylos carnosus]